MKLDIFILAFLVILRHSALAEVEEKVPKYKDFARDIVKIQTEFDNLRHPFDAAEIQHTEFC